MKKAMLALWATFVATMALAQGPPGPPRPGRGGFGPEGFGFGMHPGKVVTGAPYSATATNSSTQTLSDGNTIQHTNTAQVARDSVGRTFEQLTITGGPLAQAGPTTITFISDPTAGFSYALNPTTKVAERRAIKAPPAGANQPPPDGPRGLRGNAAKSSNRIVTDLGTQVINGVNATGKSVTHTIPAGQMGNTQPIVSIIETWYSPDLQVPVLSKRTDPRTGQHVYALTNIVRGDPPANLFQIPADYTVKDAPARGPRGFGPPPQN